MKKKLLDEISKCHKLVHELQSGMTCRPAISPTDGGVGEWEKAIWLEEKLRSWGITDIERMDAPDPRAPSGKRPNIIVNIKGKQEKKVWLLCHLDVVPPGELSFWDSNPWELTIDKNDPDIIRGRGVEDNQQSIVAALLIAKVLSEQKIVSDYGLSIMLLSDEESQNTYGIDYILKEFPCPIKSDDLVLVPDFGTKAGDLLEVAEKGVLWLRVSVLGKQCHASTPEDGVNALVASAEMILRMKEVENALSERNALFSPDRTTIIPTRHDSNVPNINTIPGKEVFFIDCRVLPAYTIDHIVSLVKKLGSEIESIHGVNVNVEIYSAEPAAKPTDPKSEVVVRLQKSIKTTYNIDCIPGGVGGSTMASRIRALDIPAAVWSSAMPNYHQPNEGSRISSTIGDAQVFARLLFEE